VSRDPSSDPPSGGTGRLILVATPIGNFADLSPRAREALAGADLIAAEDTRETLKLLRHHGLRGELISYHDHNEDSRAAQLCERIRAGQTVVLVSDAGTPAIADPGYRVVSAARDAGLPVTILPGPCAVTSAVAASGLPPDRFYFLGFLPRKPGQRAAAIEAVRHHPSTLVLFEAPHRMLATLADLERILGNRRALLAWNLSKDNERYLGQHLGELRAELAAWEYVHGEMTLVVAGAPDGDVAERWQRADAGIRLLLARGVDLRAIRDAVSALCELPRREVYQRVLALGDATAVDAPGDGSDPDRG
jgi:16S rRNA (cytidine1402-2'-O)-methyltransferase